MTSTTATIHGNTYTTLAGLLEKAHQDGLNNIETKLIVAPHENADRLAIVHAKVVTTRGSFEATGDASSENVGEGIQVHLVRMAETRAIARALRFATNSPSTSAEELSDPSHPVQVFDQRMRGESNGNGDRKITSRQMGMILRLLREQGVKQDQFRAEVESRFGTSLDNLAIGQASELIQEMMAT